MKIFVYVKLIISLSVIQLNAQNKKAATIVVNDKALNFIVMGDWGRVGDDHQRQVAAQMGKTAEQADIDFIIATGDNFYPKGVKSEFDPLWKSSFEDIYTSFSLHTDWYPVLGNHDYGSNPEAQIAYSKISRRWNMPARYYSKKLKVNGDSTQQVLIVFIDTTPLVKGYYNGNGHAVHGQDTVAQKSWIEKTLSDQSPNIKWKLVVGHHPMYTGGSRTENQDTRNIRGSLQAIFEKYNVDAYIAGHEHSLQHIMGPDGKVNHFISGAASEKTPARMLTNSRFVASQYGFMLFSIDREKIVIQVIDFVGNIIYSTALTQ